MEKKFVKHQYLLHISSQYGELWPTNGYDQLLSFGHPSKFQWVSCLGFITAPMSLSGGHPDVARCLAISWHRAPPIFATAAIMLGIGPHSSCGFICLIIPLMHCETGGRALSLPSQLSLSRIIILLSSPSLLVVVSQRHAVSRKHTQACSAFCLLAL